MPRNLLPVVGSRTGFSGRAEAELPQIAAHVRARSELPEQSLPKVKSSS